MNRLLNRARRRTTEVECTHRELSSWFTDGLCGDDADSFTDVDHVSTSEIAAVTFHANYRSQSTCQSRTDLRPFDADLFDLFIIFFGDLLLSFDNDFIRHGSMTSSSATRPRIRSPMRLDDFAAFNEGRNRHTHRMPQSISDDDDVLSDVDETTSQVTGVRGFQSGIGQTFTSSVSRNEVLENCQTFTEIRRDRRFDNFARWFRHQTAHTGQLSNLSRGTPRARISHDEDGVEARTRHLFTGDVELLSFNLTHHLFGDASPVCAHNIHDFIVALAVGDQTFVVLLFNFFNLAFRLIDQRLFSTSG